VTPEEFIQNNPFPANGIGEQINNRLVQDIQNPSKAAFKQRNLNKLLKNNARLIYLIYHQYNYGQSLASTMSFVYEGLRKATQTYDPNVGAKFYQYAVQTIRGILQNYYNYNEDLIHIPVMKKKKVDKKTNKEKGIKHEFCDVNDYSECQYLHVTTEHEETDNRSEELTMILAEYENQPNISKEIKEEIKIFKMAREYTLKDISSKTGINTVRLRKIIDNITTRLIKFYQKMRKDLY
jgi:DNA-directed RNA polymerase sigma subunit (sigma70/sigma32)